jgi:3-phenylpropionate/trans-cinnamate dioxygenase ferredoxin component
MRYVKAAKTAELNAGDKKRISLEGKEILLANVAGSYYAVDSICTHMGGQLDQGKLDGSHIICPRHGSVFDVTNGKVVQSGKLFFMNVKVRDLHSYPVRIEGDDISIGMD